MPRNARTHTVRHVYVIGAEAGPFKIGIATDPHQRRAEIQNGNPIKVMVLHSVSVDPQDALAVEGAVHRLLAKRRLAGEWFDVPCGVAKSLVDRTARRYAKARSQEAKRLSAEAAEVARLEAERLEAERAEIIKVHGVDLIHRVTDKEYAAENAKMAWERDAPRRAFLKRMADGRRAKKEHRQQEDARLADAAVKLQNWLDESCS